MIALVVLFMLGMLLPFVFVYGALFWLLALPFLLAWPYAKAFALRLNIPKVWVTRIVLAVSILAWISIVKAAS